MSDLEIPDTPTEIAEVSDEVPEASEMTEAPEVAEVSEEPAVVSGQQEQTLDVGTVRADAIDSATERVAAPELDSKSSRKHLYDDAVGTFGEELAIRSIGGTSLDTTVKNQF